MLSIVQVGATVTVTGTASADTITIDSEPTGITATLNGTSQSFAFGTITTVNVFGLAGDDLISVKGDFASASVVLTIDGGTGSNTLRSLGGISPNNWVVSAGNSGTLNGSGFSNIQNLKGSIADDNFQFGPAGFVFGNVDGGGGAGIDTLDYSSKTVGATVNLFTGVATAIGGTFSNVTDFIGSSDNTDVITGQSTDNIWHISNGNYGDINQNYFFSGFENLMGGAGVDTFKFAPGGFVSGSIDGGGGPGANTLDYSGRTAGIQMAIQLNKSTAIGGTFNRIGLVIGSSGSSDVVVGSNDANTWYIDSGNAGSVRNSSYAIAFQGIENLLGGTSFDQFKFATNGFVAGYVNGGGGTNTLDYSSRTDGITLNVTTGTATAVGGGFTYIQSFVGGSGTTGASYNTLIGPNATNNDWYVTGPNSGNMNGNFTFFQVENLFGGIRNDTFHMGPSGFVSGVIYGGQGTNTLDYSGRSIGVNVSLQPKANPDVSFATDSATAIGGGFNTITNLIGTQDYDMLTGADGSNTWNITGADSGNVVGNSTVGPFTFTGIENLTGGKGADVFKFAVGGSVSRTVRGTRPLNYGIGETDPGADWLDYSALSTPVSVNLNTGSATGLGSVAYVQNVHGGNGTNTLTGNQQGNVLVGGSGNDTIIGGSGRSLLIGGLGSDIVTGGSADDIVIGGFTDYDSNPTALSAILAEWQSSHTFSVRVNYLRNGGGSIGLNGLNVLVADQTVHTDAVPNVITGGNGQDWFWGGPSEFTDFTRFDISNTPVSNAAILTGASFYTYTIGAPAAPLNNSLAITALGTKTFAFATVKIVGNFIPRQDGLGFTPGSGTGNIVGSFDSTTGTLTLSSTGSTATVAQFQAALDQVTYVNGAATPNTALRTVNFQVSDGKTLSNVLVEKIGFNTAPVVAGTSTINYVTGQAATLVNTGITVADSTNFTLASATVSFVGNFYFPAEDFLTFTGSAATGNITGSFNSTTGVMTLTSAGSTASVSQFQAALRSVSYVNFSSTPTTFQRTLAYQVFDGCRAETGDVIEIRMIAIPKLPRQT